VNRHIGLTGGEYVEIAGNLSKKGHLKTEQRAILRHTAFKPRTIYLTNNRNVSINYPEKAGEV
jgi:hypothetical protein